MRSQCWDDITGSTTADAYLPGPAAALTQCTREHTAEMHWQLCRLTSCMRWCRQRRWTQPSDRVRAAAAPLLHVCDGCLHSGPGRRLCCQCHHPPWPARCCTLTPLTSVQAPFFLSYHATVAAFTDGGHLDNASCSAALLYIVPFTLGAVALTAAVRGETSQLLKFTDVSTMPPGKSAKKTQQ